LLLAYLTPSVRPARPAAGLELAAPLGLRLAVWPAAVAATMLGLDEYSPQHMPFSFEFPEMGR
jgi:hypothetical protein